MWNRNPVIEFIANYLACWNISACRSVHIKFLSNLLNNFRDKTCERREIHNFLYTNLFHEVGGNCKIFCNHCGTRWLKQLENSTLGNCWKCRSPNRFINPHSTIQRQRYKVVIQQQKLFLRGTKPTGDKVAYISVCRL